MKLHSVINFVLFQAVWFLSLLLEGQSIYVTPLVIALMFYLSKQKKHDAILIFKALPLGLLGEYIAVKIGLLEFHSYPFPLWLVFLWASLVLCINSSMSFLTSLKFWQAFLVCLAFAPASYWAGARFGVLNLQFPLIQFWLIYGLIWSSMFTLILFINSKIKPVLNTKSL